LASIPVAALLGALTFAHLWVVAFAVGALTIFFATASISILPALVKREQLVDANSKLAVSDSILTIIGPGAAGALVQLVSAPRAIIMDALSYLLSALALRGVGASESLPDRSQRRGIWVEMAEGMRDWWGPGAWQSGRRHLVRQPDESTPGAHAGRSLWQGDRGPTVSHV
jgi:hypothetical protein